tara:strand:- start:811 stop:2652 length:1842 start_codon:yes stop_codon:yes gene_type:complete
MEEEISIESYFPIPETDKEIKKFIQEVPESPGVYKFLDESYEPLYIGKAKILKNRVASYFRNSSKTKKIIKLFEEAAFIDFALTNTELESLLHEQFLIKEKKPKFNVQFKDDKGYPWIKIEISKDFPAAKSFLGKKLDKGKYFGPFPNSYAVRDVLKLIQKTFKLRNCSDSYFKNRSRPCIQYEIGRCSAPCIGLISKKDYLKEVNNAELLLNGKSKELIDNFYTSMDSFSKKKDYEKAAIYRDRISALRDIQRSQSVAGFKTSRDAIFISSHGRNIKIGVTSVSQGWVTGHKNFSLNLNYDEENILESFLTNQYLTNHNCPRALITNRPVKNKKLLEEALYIKHKKKISIITKPGKKDKGLLDVCKVNTEHVLRKDRHDKNITYKFKKLKAGLEIKQDLKKIECYDISHHSGKNAIAGCTVYTAEGKARGQYRTYNISQSNSGNDIGSMVELIERRFLTREREDLPDLIIIDGGKVHLKTIIKKLEDSNIYHIDIISISKGIRRKASFDTIHLSNGKSFSVDKTEVFHQFIQEIRDETHRFSIEAQKRKMRKTSIQSSLDDLYGVGIVRKKQLLRYFGSVDQLKRAGIEDLQKVEGIGKKVAQNIYHQLIKS